MNNKMVSGFVALVLTGAVSASGADIIGKVIFKGTPPPEIPLPLDPNCGKLVPAGEKPTTKFYVVGENNGLADVYVTVDGISGKSTGASAEPGVLDQVHCEYTPYVTAIQTGQKLVVKNSDPLLHNVHPTPAPGTRNKEANKAQLPKGPDLEFVFPDAEEFLRFKCDVHPWMFAYVNVVDHPYYDVSKNDGTFRIKNVPAGKHTIVAKHRKAAKDGISKEVTVGDADVTIEFVMEAP